ncbi:MAG: amino-acid N-acetyltransferase [Treponema sp.]|jgi:amino-acid N-acetyltransferase|nr:amino-acid N-acetyltransferase [Treponema sp.]
MDATKTSRVELIREAFHYQSRFDGSTMVFKIDCSIIDDPHFPSLMKDMALLAKTGFRVVIVPGATEWIDSTLKKHGIVSTYYENVRITTSEAIPFVEMAAFHVATRFMTLSASRVDAIIGNFVRARGMGVINGVDMQHTGVVDKVLLDSLERALKQGMAPILPCIGWSPVGKPYNVASDEIALATASALGAIKLFIVSKDGCLKAGVYDVPKSVDIDENGRIVKLNLQEAGVLLAANKDRAPNKSLKSLELGIQATKAGVERVHIVDGCEEGVILKELFSNMGSGAMIYTDEYEAMRSLRSSDIPDVLRLMEPLMQKGVLIRRTPEAVQEKKEDYVVAKVDGSIRACAALHDWGENQAEIAAVATDPLFAAMGLGRRIVKYLIETAAKKGFTRIFVLTTTTQDWFETLGFKEAPVESLPVRRRSLYNQQRKSKVFALDIEGIGKY